MPNAPPVLSDFSRNSRLPKLSCRAPNVPKNGRRPASHRHDDLTDLLVRLHVAVGLDDLSGIDGADTPGGANPFHHMAGSDPSSLLALIPFVCRCHCSREIHSRI